MKNCEKRENFPTFNEILKMAKSIVSFFPSAGSFNTESPWDLFFDDKTRKGSLESYMRGKRTRKQLSDKLLKRPKTVFLCPEGDSYTEDEIREAEEFMRLTQLDSKDTRNHNRSEMLRLMKVTYQSRRAFLQKWCKVDATVFLNKYPRLKDMPEAIRDEFFRLKNSTLETFASNWRKAECKIIDFSKQKFPKSLAVLDIVRKAEEAEEKFDIPERMKCVLQLTLHAAANTQPSQNKKGSTADGWNLLYQSFNELLLPEDAANRANEMELPGVLDINGAYYIKIDHSVSLTETKSFEQAVGYLIMYYHILDINYPSKLKFVYGFLEAMFEIVPSMNPSKKMKDLCSFVFN